MVLSATTAKNGQLCSGPGERDVPPNIFRVHQFMAIYREKHITRQEVRAAGGTAWDDPRDADSGVPIVQGFQLQSHPGALNGAFMKALDQDFEPVHGDGVSDVLGCSFHGGGHSDDRSMDIDQGTSAAPLVESGIGLNEVGIFQMGSGVNIAAMKCADDAGGGRERHARRVPHGQYPVADPERSGVSQLEVREIRGLDSEKRDVSRGVRAHYRGLQSPSIVELNLNGVGGSDQVFVGENQPVGSEQERRASAFLRMRFFRVVMVVHGSGDREHHDSREHLLQDRCEEVGVQGLRSPWGTGRVVPEALGGLADARDQDAEKGDEESAEQGRGHGHRTSCLVDDLGTLLNVFQHHSSDGFILECLPAPLSSEVAGQIIGGAFLVLTLHMAGAQSE